MIANSFQSWICMIPKALNLSRIRDYKVAAAVTKRLKSISRRDKEGQ